MARARPEAAWGLLSVGRRVCEGRTLEVWWRPGEFCLAGLSLLGAGPGGRVGPPAFPVTFKTRCEDATCSRMCRPVPPEGRPVRPTGPLLSRAHTLVAPAATRAPETGPGLFRPVSPGPHPRGPHPTPHAGGWVGQPPSRTGFRGAPPPRAALCPPCPVCRVAFAWSSPWPE